MLTFQQPPIIGTDWPPIVFPEDGPKAVARRILREFEVLTNVPADAIRAGWRIKSVCAARRLAAARIAAETPLAWHPIGHVLNCDHTTVIHAVKSYNEAHGTNIRGVGIVSPARRERCRAASRRKLTTKQRVAISKRRQSQLEGQVVWFFNAGLSAPEVAAMVKRSPRFVNAVRSRTQKQVSA